ncbi:MAG TPA: 23S rRNA (pseudouridine(1915)-N(3))-methyltransferase RlmH [Acidobacteriaceae bacterium]|nr:23S rRNA (pseudouridine(1915)-N(3))-methyltransferase RlmH [Acidobacteriaceae bacterium]
MTSGRQLRATGHWGLGTNYRLRATGSLHWSRMRIWIAAVGAHPRDAFNDLAQRYLDRIAPLLPGSGAKAGVDAPVYATEDALWQAVNRERARTVPLVVLMDERGQRMGSAEFAAWLGRERDGGRQLLIFAVGPADGWAEQSSELRAQNTGKAERGERTTASGQRSESMRLSLGPMTMAHELARVVLCEQVYRALTILAGHPYHRGSR